MSPDFRGLWGPTEFWQRIFPQFAKEITNTCKHKFYLWNTCNSYKIFQKLQTWILFIIFKLKNTHTVYPYNKKEALKIISSLCCVLPQHPKVCLSQWNATGCYSLQTMYLIFEVFQVLFPRASLISFLQLWSCLTSCDMRKKKALHP